MCSPSALAVRSGPVLDQVIIHSSDREASERFYRMVLGALGIEPSGADAGRVEWDDFAIASADAANPPTRNLHLAFVAPSRDHVDEFWRAGTASGYEDDGAPGERPQYTPGYYGAFLLDPDGNSAEAVHHRDVRRGGHIDHLWIRAGRQFRGAWATFSLVADGKPVTEGLQLTFPAPDRQTVEDFHSAATTAGYRDNGPPDKRLSPRTGYAASVLDPDGTKVDSVFREP